MKRDTIDELPGWARALLDGARVARLGLLDDRGAPRVLPVTFAVHDGAVWTAVDRKPKRDPGAEPARVRFVRRDPRAALTVDRYDDEWSALAWVQVLGRITVQAAGDATDAVTALTRKYPQYEREPPPGPVLCLAPYRILCWSAAPG